MSGCFFLKHGVYWDNLLTIYHIFAVQFLTSCIQP